MFLYCSSKADLCHPHNLQHPTFQTTKHRQINAPQLVNVYLTLSTAYELAITKSIWPPLIVRRGAWRDVYGDPLIFQPDGALIYSIDLTLRQRSPRHNPLD